MNSVTPLPQVSVVCAWYNRADFIRDTVDSLLAQDYDSFEVIIVNDGSSDPRVRKILDSYNDPRLQVVHQENTGYTVAIRRAIDMTSAPFIAIQGAGDVSLPERLRLQSAAMEANPDVAMVGCWYRLHNLVSGNVSIVKPVCPKREDIRFRGISHGELMYRRSAYDAVGGYRTMFHVGQGSDLWMRMLRGQGANIIPETLYEQRHFADGVAMSLEKRAARRVLNAARIENEIIFRKTGFDHIATYGAGALTILAGRWRVKKATVSAQVALQDLSISDAKLRWDAGPLTLLLSVPFRLLRSFLGRKSKLVG